MDIDIRKLTSDLMNDYLTFFETDAHADNPDEDRCYCVCWCSADHRDGTDFSTPEKRRELAVSYIMRGVLQGYLAYQDGKVVGWCNANTKSACINCVSWRRSMGSVATSDHTVDRKTKSIFCFTIAPGMKRKGVATKLLDRVCADALLDGFDYAEAYPNKQFINEFRSFRGPLEMYVKRGFVICDETERLFVMQKALHRHGKENGE